MFVFSQLLGVLTFGLHVLVPLIGLIIIGTRTQGLARRLGVAGCAALVVVGVLQAVWVFAAPRLIRSAGGATTYGAVSALFSVLSAAGLALVIVAVVVGRGQAQGQHGQVHGQGQPPVQPNPYQQPYPQGPYQSGPYQQPPR